MSERARKLAEIAVGTIHHDAQEPEMSHELDELERRFDEALPQRSSSPMRALRAKYRQWAREELEAADLLYALGQFLGEP